jgi:hypothetical protein
MPLDPPDDERPTLIRGVDALGLGIPRHELVEMLAIREESAPFDHARLANLERGIYLVGSDSETKHRERRAASAHWYGFVPSSALELACVERLLGARPARVRERVRRALSFADQGPLKPAPTGAYRDAVLAAGAMMALGESARAAAWLERLGDRDADLVWPTTYGPDDERVVVRHRGWTGFRAALRALAAGRDDRAIDLAERTRKAVAPFVSRPPFALLDAHTALLAAVARGDASSAEEEVSRTDSAWRKVFAQPGFELDVRIAIDFIASGVLATAQERGIRVVSKPALALPVGEPEWVRGLVVAERGSFGEGANEERTTVECPACSTAARRPSSALDDAWPSLRAWRSFTGPLDAWGHRYERVPGASRSHEVSILTPPSAWSRCPECASVLLPILVVDEEDRTLWRLDVANTWMSAAECTWAPSVTFETPWSFAPHPVAAGVLRWMVDDVTR